MPKRTDIKKILVVGAGPIVIGQACEFDYSGTQAVKALKEEGYNVVLVNSNPATIMTDPDLADSTYIEPLTVEFLEKVIEAEKPDAILPTVGGQTALNLSLALAQQGILAKHNITMIGANAESIEKAENRKLFNDAMKKIGLECPKNAIVQTLEEALAALEVTGLPAIIRPSFTLGGAGGGIAKTREEFIDIVTKGLEESPSSQLLIDESVIGWKEFEMEVIRDKNDNCIIICSIENIDPMGVHTGDSITVAPALTLTDKEYQIMRDASIAVLREIGVDTGGSNVQFAVNPEDGRMLVIEMNPRVSRSSALASKATGFPIAKVAAKLAVGYSLDEILNDCTKVTPASFEPVIDYIVTKIPRFTFEKFSETDRELSSSMKSVGEVMAMGRSFAESLQKALCSMENGLNGLDEIDESDSVDELKRKLATLTPDRLLLIGQGFRKGISIDELHKITSYDMWFLRELQKIVEAEKTIKEVYNSGDRQDWFKLKSMGFSDKRMAKLAGVTEREVYNKRIAMDLRPVFKRVDTCAAEFNSDTPYMYSCYEGDGINDGEDEAIVSTRKKVVILGSGPNRIGQGIEFDYACVQAAYSLKEEGIETIMINCNPETVSTDYDTSDRLYFEPLTEENVVNIIKKEQEKGEFLGAIIQFGGQTPLKLAKRLQQENIPILGTSPDKIDEAEDRERFGEFLQRLGAKHPENFICKDEIEATNKAEIIGFPVIVRPSYVLGGRAMEVIYDKESLALYFQQYREFFEYGPILVDRFLTDAIEIDVDAICDSTEVFVAGVMQHIEEAGIHSGDSSCSLPAYSLSDGLIKRIEDLTRKIALNLGVIGFMNVQYAVKDNEIYVIEVNPRASRTVPFVAKSIGVQAAKIAAKVLIGKTLKQQNIVAQKQSNYFSVKHSVFPFARFKGVDVVLGPEMKSTGEVMGVDTSFQKAFAKAFVAAGNKLPKSGTAFISVKDSDKNHAIELAQNLNNLGFKLVATKGTADFLRGHNIKLETVNKVAQGSPHIVDMIESGKIDLVINTTQGKKSLADSFSIRRGALINKVPYQTTISGAKAILMAIDVWQKEDFNVVPVQKFKVK